MAEDAKDLSAQEQEAENAWRYAKSRILEKVLNNVAVPVPKRKNPLVELRVNGILVNTVRYRDYRYDHFKDLVGTKSVWAKLHYDEKDIPYLDVIWNRGKEADEAS